MSRWHCGIVVCFHFLGLFGWKGKERTFEEAGRKMLTLIGLDFFFSLSSPPPLFQPAPHREDRLVRMKRIFSMISPKHAAHEQAPYDPVE